MVNATLRPLYSQERDPVPIVLEQEGLQGQSGRLRNISSPTEMRYPDRPTRNESLYRLSYSGPPVESITRDNRICHVLSPFAASFVSCYRFIPSLSINSINTYRGADKSLARPGRKEATATEDFDVHISYL